MAVRNCPGTASAKTLWGRRGPLSGVHLLLLPLHRSPGLGHKTPNSFCSQLPSVVPWAAQMMITNIERWFGSVTLRIPRRARPRPSYIAHRGCGILSRVWAPGSSQVRTVYYHGTSSPGALLCF